MLSIYRSLIATIMVAALSILITPLKAQETDNRYQRGPFLAEDAPKAPEWEISEWVRGPATSLKKLKGKVVVIDFFQLWCPGCNKFSIPLMAEWERIFEKDIKQGRLALISIHTVFEGHAYQNVKRLRRYVKEKNFKHPVGVDRHQPGKHTPITMERYRTYGTPEMAFIDKQGNIRFQKLGWFDPDWATFFVRSLIEEKDPNKSKKAERKQSPSLKSETNYRASKKHKG